MILWGYNPSASSVLHYGRQILDAKDRGAKLVVIDPLLTPLAAKADIWLQPRPGSDGALALALLNVIINEELHDRVFVDRWTVGFSELKNHVQSYTPEMAEKITWVDANKIREVARLYAASKPAVVEDGNGIDQHTNVVQTDRLIAILRAVTGNIGVPGSHIFRPGSGLADISLKEKTPVVPSITRNPFYTNLSGQISTPHVVDTILTEKPYPVRAMIVHGSAVGSLASNANKAMEAFSKLSLLVVHELFMTDVAEIADYVLPAATYLEQSCLVSNPPAGPSPSKDTAFYGMIEKAVEPLGEAWDDHAFIWGLAKKLGLGEYFTTPEDLFNEELAPLGLSVAKLREYPGGCIRRFEPEEIYHTFEKSGFKTPSGKVELWSQTLEKAGFDPLPVYTEPAESPLSKPEIAVEYPLVGSVGLHLGLFTHTQYRTLPWLREIHRGAFVNIHPLKGEELGIRNGDEVYVESPRGRIKVATRITEEVDPRVAMVTWGWGQPYAGGDRVNVLTDDEERCPISGSTGNRSFLCRVVKVGVN
jgi:anaerobic selenocysteine-containing dehydrogenase